MGAFLESLSIKEENVTGAIDYLKGNVFQKINLVAQIRVETWLQITVDAPLSFADGFYTNDQWIVDQNGTGAFAEFNVDDTIVITGTSSNNFTSATIQEKIDDNNIRLNQTLTQVSETAGTIYLNQRPKGVTWDYGLIENAEATNFFSKVDGNLMRFEYGTSSNIPNTFTDMNAVGKLSWQLGQITLDNTQVKDVSSSDDINNYRYIIQINQDFLIHPFYLDNQILDLLNEQPPRYFRLSDCLKHVFRFRAYKELQNPNIFQELIFDGNEGNTGWFDEEYNGGDAEYEATNLSYSNSLGLTRDDTVTVTFDIENTADNTNGLAQYVCVNLILLPEDAADYQNINTPMYQNYGFDRALATTGGGAVQGINNGTGWEAINDLTVTSGTGKVSVSLDIDFGADMQSKIDSLSNKRYLLSAYAVANGMTASDANYVNMLVDVKEIQVDIPDATVTVTNDFYKHDENTYTGAGAGLIDMNVEEEIVADSLILLDRAAPYSDIQIDSVKVGIIATDGTEVVELYMDDFDLTSAPEIGGLRFVNSTTQDAFAVNPTEIRKNIMFIRSASEDTGTQVAYRVRLPFLIRWETWEQLILSSLPADFLDTAEPFDGYNQQWFRLSVLSGWDLKYRVETVVTSMNTQKTIISDTSAISLHSYDDGSGNWTSGSIECYDGATALTVGGQPYILSNAVGRNTTIRATFTYNGGGSMPTANDVFMVIRIIPKEGGTFIANDTASSVWDRSAVSYLTGTGGKISLQVVGSEMIGECEIDYNDIPQGVNEFTISAFIREK